MATGKVTSARRKLGKLASQVSPFPGPCGLVFQEAATVRFPGQIVVGEAPNGRNRLNTARAPAVTNANGQRVILVLKVPRSQEVEGYLKARISASSQYSSVTDIILNLKLEPEAYLVSCEALRPQAQGSP